MSSAVQRCNFRLLRNSVTRRGNYSKPSLAISGVSRVSCQVDGTDLSSGNLQSGSRMVHSAAQTNWATQTGDERKELMALWPDVLKDLTESGRYLDIPDVIKWMAKVLKYNVPSVRNARNLAVVHAYKKLAQPKELTEENLRLARILGWCAELSEACFLITDDMLDHSKIRRGQKCWHLYENIGLGAINDSILLQQSTYQLLRTHFRDKPCYLNLIETFHDATLETSMGQTLDILSTQLGDKPNLDLFTMDRVNAIVKYKAACYAFALPVTLAMYFAGIKDPEMHRQAKAVMLEIGQFYQVQDDYLDCYGEPETMGKKGNDIQEGKCSWLAIVALQRATPAQRKIFEECYGINDAEKIARIKQLYDDLGLQTAYLIYEDETYSLINEHIRQISRDLPHDLFFHFLSKIYRRNK